MIVTDDEALYWNAKRFADRGKPFGSTEARNLSLGMNYRMTELQAAMGRVQLRKLPALVERRRALVERIRVAIADLSAVRLGKVIEGAESSYWFLLVRVDASRLTVDKEAFARAVAAEGLPVSPSYDHVAYDAPWLRERVTFGTSGLPWSSPACGPGQRYDPDPCPNARRAIAEHMMASVHEGWTEREVEDFAAALRKVEGAYLG
jgi:dTDP-4-amino-4,6-dideoxygalactose transaminase